MKKGAILAATAALSLAGGAAYLMVSASTLEPIYVEDFEDGQTDLLIIDNDYNQRYGTWGIVEDPLDPENLVFGAAPPNRDDSAYIPRRMDGPYMVKCRAMFNSTGQRMGFVFNAWPTHGGNRWLRWSPWMGNHMHFDHWDDNSSRWGEVPGEWPQPMTWYRLKLMVLPQSDGSVHAFAKVWPDGTDEPLEWISSYDIESGGSFGAVGLYAYKNASFYDDLALYDLTGVAPDVAIEVIDPAEQGWADLVQSQEGHEDEFWEFSFKARLVPNHEGSGQGEWVPYPTLTGMSTPGFHQQDMFVAKANTTVTVTKHVASPGEGLPHTCRWSWIDPTSGEETELWAKLP